MKEYMKWLSLVLCVKLTSSQFSPIIKTHTPCDNSSKKTLIEHFFNIIFSEFHTPPVCVCVQMCAGESTYCYPNGCLKMPLIPSSNVIKTHRVEPIKQKQFMLVSDEKLDFMTDFLEKNYAVETKTDKQTIIAEQDLRSDFFKDKYSKFGKLKRQPKVEFKYNIREQVKNSKSDLVKIETADITKTRWPMNRQLKANLHEPKKATPLIGKPNFFTTMLSDNEVAEYPPKYFKRELAKIGGDDVDIKAFYVSENSFNGTENASLSLGTLIDNLIRSSLEANANASNAVGDEAGIETNAAIEKLVSINSTSSANETTSVISMNFTNENVDKNRYADDSNANKTALNEMITHLAKEIEKQNNTSMEIAKRYVNNLHIFNQTTPFINSHIENVTEVEHKSTVTIESSTVQTSTLREVVVTKKNRQRRVKKFTNSKLN